MVKHILITGASGLIGTRLTEMLLEKGYSVAHLGRSKKEGRLKSFVWNIDKSIIETSAFKGITTIIHLAGAGIADKRWTTNRRREILESRTKSTALLFEELNKGHHHVNTFISASAIGYYGFEDAEKIYTENYEAGNDFLAQVTKQWEDEVDRINALNIRLVKFRVGIVLSDRGGALKEMIAPIRLYAGAPLGSGNQFLSWIHIDDLCNMFLKAVEDEQLFGVYNATGITSVTNKELTKAIADVLKKPLILPNIPPFVLKLILGEMADLVLKGARVSSEKIQKTGFTFQFEELKSALENLLASS